MPPKFGLIKMQGFAKGVGLGGKKAGPAAAANIKKPPAAASIFGGGGDSDDDDDDAADRRAARASKVDVRGVNSSLVAQQAHSSNQTEKLAAAALAEDANVFAYDELYDDISSVKAEQRVSPTRKSRR